MVAGFLIFGGLAVLYYGIKYSEFEVFSGDTEVDVKAAAQAWINNGAPLTATSRSFKALVDIVGSFNTFMEDLESNDMLAEFMAFDEATGKKVLQDLIIQLPNGLVIKVISAESVVNFRIDIDDETWKGFYMPLFKAPGYFSYLAMRLTSSPNFSYTIPNSDELTFIDPLDGQVKLGKDCTPPQSITDGDAEYMVSSIILFSYLCKFLYNSGFKQTLIAYWRNRVLKRSLKIIRTELDLLSECSDRIENVCQQVITTLNEFNGDWSQTVPTIIPKIKKLGYRPYG